MHSLDPYSFYWIDNAYKFETEYGNTYSVYFHNDIKCVYSDYEKWCDNIYEIGFDLLATNAEENKKKQFDPRISDTIITIVDNFFQNQQNVLLYVCESLDDYEELSRSKLFSYWYNRHNNSTTTYSLQKIDFEGTMSGTPFLSSIILHNTNEYLQEISDAFIYTCKTYYTDSK